MVAKKKKVVSKKPVKKAVKKTKKVIKKTIKKIVKKPAAKKAVKKIIKAKQPIKKVTQKIAKKAAPKKTLLKKPIAKPIVKPVVKPIVKQKIMKEQRSKKMTEKLEYNAGEEFDVIQLPQRTTPRKATTLLGALEFTPYQPNVNETYMNDAQRAHFRKILDAWKQQLMQDVDLTVGHLKEEAVFYADPVDRATQEEGFNLELRTRDRERKLIKKIEQSLDLLNTGEYGHCEDCGADIGIRRLEARPTAVKCIDCKTFQEIREKQLGG